jgi:hypothetical protein
LAALICSVSSVSRVAAIISLLWSIFLCCHEHSNSFYRVSLSLIGRKTISLIALPLHNKWLEFPKGGSSRMRSTNTFLMAGFPAICRKSYVVCAAFIMSCRPTLPLWQHAVCRMVYYCRPSITILWSVYFSLLRYFETIYEGSFV